MAICEECRKLELAVQDAHNARVLARGKFETNLHVPEARKLAMEYRATSDAYHRALSNLQLHRDGHGED